MIKQNQLPSPAGLKEYILRFLEYLEIEKGRSQSTIKNYAIYLNRFARFAKVTSPFDISPTLVRDYRLYLSRYLDKFGRPLKRNSQNHHLIALRSLLRYLIRSEDLEVLPVEKVELAKEEEREIKVLNSEELRRLLATPDLKTPRGKRDKAILELLFSSGMRVSELTSLDVEDVNFETREIPVLGKGGKRRVVFLSDDAGQALADYLKAREEKFKPLFINFMKRGEDKENRLTVRAIQKMIKKYGRKAGLSSDPTPHTMRHTFATDLLREGADIRAVQEMLGHKDISTTQIYTHVTNPQLKKVHEKYHRGNK